MGRQHGFTIIEVILFLAITGLLLFVTLQSVGSNINNSRYTDTLKSMQDYLQSQYSEVQSGVSHRDTNDSCGGAESRQTPGTSDTCIVIGRLIDIVGSTLNVYALVGDINADAGPQGECSAGGASIDLKSIADHCPRVAINAQTGEAALADTYVPEWGATIGNLFYDKGGSRTIFNRIVFVRDPAPGSEASYILTYFDNSAVGDVRPSDQQTVNKNRPAIMCLQAAQSPTGFTYFSGNSSLSSIITGVDLTTIDPVLGAAC